MQNIKRRNEWALIIVILAAGLLLMAASSADAKVPESSDPIVITLNDWDSQLTDSYILGGILEKMGYKVKYQQADYLAQFVGIKSGDLTVATEIWETTAKKQFAEAVASGEALDMGSIGAKAIEDWWYPSYVEKMCPGLPDWKALKKCAKVFAAPQTAPMGRFVGGSVTWDTHSKERIEALDLPFKVIHAGSAAALFAEIQSAVKRKQPIVAWAWQPSWVTTKYDGHFVDFPKYESDCYTDPSWGTNSEKKYDCGNPRGWIKKIAWAGGEKKWPAAYQLIRNFKLSTKILGGFSVKAALEHWNPQKIATWWINHNEDVWQKWVQDAKESADNSD